MQALAYGISWLSLMKLQASWKFFSLSFCKLSFENETASNGWKEEKSKRQASTETTMLTSARKCIWTLKCAHHFVGFFNFIVLNGPYGSLEIVINRFFYMTKLLCKVLLLFVTFSVKSFWKDIVMYNPINNIKECCMPLDPWGEFFSNLVHQQLKKQWDSEWLKNFRSKIIDME